MANADDVVYPRDLSVSGSPVKFPMEPMGDACFVEKMESDHRGKIMIPQANGSQGDPRAEFVFGKVIAVGPGTFSISGVRTPCDIKVGDIVTLPLVAAMRISMGLRNELIARGSTAEYIDKIMVVQFEHITARLL